MFNLNKILAYSISTLTLCTLILMGINYEILEKAWLWTIILPLSLPLGIILETFYSLIYKPVRSFLEKRKWFLKLVNDDYYILNQNDINYFKPEKNKRYEELLSENNIVRNMWMSGLIALVFLIIIYFLLVPNTITSTYVFYWLPLIIILAFISNIRTEILLKRTKMFLYKNK